MTVKEKPPCELSRGLSGEEAGGVAQKCGVLNASSNKRDEFGEYYKVSCFAHN